MDWAESIIKLEKEFIKCDISAKYDVITFEYRLYTDTFALPRKQLVGFTHGWRKTKYPVNRFHPIWQIDKYVNTETGNLIFYLASNRLRTKDGKTFYMVKIDFHGERSPLTSAEINKFLDLVNLHYQNFADNARQSRVFNTKILEIPKPVLTKVEIALDFTGIDTSLLHDNLSGNLYKKRCRRRWSVSEEETIKQKYTFDGRTLYSVFPTNYLSNSFRDYVFTKEEQDYYRFEITLVKSYLKRNTIQTTEDLERFDHVRYWTDNFSFLQLDKGKILSYIKKKKPELIYPISILINAESLWQPSEIFDRLKKYKALNEDKKLFSDASRFFKTKWQTFDGMIQNALNRLTLSGSKGQNTFQPIQRERDKVPAKKGRKSKEGDIKKAIEEHERRTGKKPTYKQLARSFNVSEKTIAKYKHLLK